MDLLTRSEVVDGRTCHVYESCGGEYLVHDDARTALRIIRLFGDEEARPEQKLDVLLREVFARPEDVRRAGSDLWRVIADITWQAYSLDLMDEHHSTGRRVLDWEEDAPRVKATLLQAYGLMWEEICTRVSYRDLVDMVCMAPRETPMGTALYYRVADPPKRTKGNAEQVRAFRKMKELYRLKGEGTAKSDYQRVEDVFRGMYQRRAGKDGVQRR